MPSALAGAIASQVQHILNAPAAGADMKVNADLRPEGFQGAGLLVCDGSGALTLRRPAPGFGPGRLGNPSCQPTRSIR